MRKKDPEINENMDRSAGSKNTSGTDDPANDRAAETGAGQFTKVKNASASGLGTMGRSDEKLADTSGNGSSDAY